MKKYFLALLVAFYATNAFAVSSTFNITSKLQAPVSVVEVTALTFGAIVHSPALASTITLNNSDAATSDQPSDVITAAKTGVYNISGGPSTIIYISVDNIVSLNNSGTTLTTTLTPASASVFVSAGATFPFKVYGNIQIPVNAAMGDYTGSFMLTANY